MSTIRFAAIAATGVLALTIAAAGARLASSAASPDASTSTGTAADLATKPRAAAPASMTSPGKPLPPIEVDYSIVGVPSVGQPLEIRLRTGVPAALTALNIALSGSERLLVPAEAARLRLAFTAADERRIETIRVTPMTSGRHYLTVLAQAEIDGRLQARSVTIPIDVGGASVERLQSAPTVTDAAGQRIVILPAQAN